MAADDDSVEPPETRTVTTTVPGPGTTTVVRVPTVFDRVPARGLTRTTTPGRDRRAM